MILVVHSARTRAMVTVELTASCRSKREDGGNDDDVVNVL